MSVITAPGRAQPRIKSPPSQRRRFWQVAIFTAAGVLLALAVTRYFRREDAAHLHELTGFLSAYAMECDAPDFNAPPAPLVRDAYLHSRALQDVVARESAALKAGTSCDEVTRALRDADFPAALPARQPTIHLRPTP